MYEHSYNKIAREYVKLRGERVKLQMLQVYKSQIWIMNRFWQTVCVLNLMVIGAVHTSANRNYVELRSVDCVIL